MLKLEVASLGQVGDLPADLPAEQGVNAPSRVPAEWRGARFGGGEGTWTFLPPIVGTSPRKCTLPLWLATVVALELVDAEEEDEETEFPLNISATVMAVEPPERMPARDVTAPPISNELE